MPEADGVAIARLQEQVRGVRKDVAEIVAELGRARARLHNLEGITQAFVDAQKMNRRREEAQYRRVELRLQVLAVVVGLASVLGPVVTIIALGK